MGYDTKIQRKRQREKETMIQTAMLVGDCVYVPRLPVCPQIDVCGSCCQQLEAHHSWCTETPQHSRHLHSFMKPRLPICSCEFGEGDNTRFHTMLTWVPILGGSMQQYANCYFLSTSMRTLQVLIHHDSLIKSVQSTNPIIITAISHPISSG